jgi:ABC-type transport system involved in cytochrome c biogenesis permease subunit
MSSEEVLMEIKERNIVVIYLLTVITFGIYGIYWLVKTKEEINSLGGEIPTAWLLIIPIANIFWAFKYCEGFASHVKKDNNTLLWFILYILVGIIMPAIVQSELNKLAGKPQAA